VAVPPFGCGQGGVVGLLEQLGVLEQVEIQDEARGGVVAAAGDLDEAAPAILPTVARACAAIT